MKEGKAGKVIMVPTTSRKQRKERLESLKQEDFACYRDFFFALHLNSYTQWAHLIGAISGLLLLAFSIYHLSITLFILYGLCFYGFGFMSHLIFDGLVSKTAKEAPWGSFIYAVEVNWLCFTGKIKKEEERFLKQYPFVRSAYIA